MHFELWGVIIAVRLGSPQSHGRILQVNTDNNAVSSQQKNVMKECRESRKVSHNIDGSMNLIVKDLVHKYNLNVSIEIVYYDFWPLKVKSRMNK